MSAVTAGIVFGMFVGAAMASAVLRSQPRRYTVSLVRGAGQRAPRVLVELPDDAIPLDAGVAHAIAREAMDVLADRYGWPLPVGVREHVDGDLVTEVNLHDAQDIARAVLAHLAGDATLVMPGPGVELARLTWHRRPV